MKKLIAIVFAVLMIFGASALSYADVISIQKDIGIQLPVMGVFGLEIWDDEFTHMLADVLPGEGATGDIHIYVSTNHGLPWSVDARCSGLTGMYQTVPETLPVLITTFDGGAGLTGTTVDDLVLTSTAQAIYTSGAGEDSCLGLQIPAIFVVKAETTTKEDLYDGTLVITLTE